MDIKEIILGKITKKYIHCLESDFNEETIFIRKETNKVSIKMWIVCRQKDYIIAYEPIRDCWHCLELDFKHLVSCGKEFEYALLTDSEYNFAKQCNKNNILLNQIIREDHKTPDYIIKLPELEIIVEVKEIVHSKDEWKQLKDFNSGKHISINVHPGQKIRNKIKKASKQIRPYLKQKYPYIIVIYSKLHIAFGEPTSPYNIKVGMYGYQTQSMNLMTQIIEKSFLGKNKKMTRELNTSISGLLVLDHNNDEFSGFRFYHNTFASNKIEKGLLKKFFFNCEEYYLDSSKTNQLPDWKNV